MAEKYRRIPTITEKKISEQKNALLETQAIAAMLYEENEGLRQEVLSAQMMIAELYEGSEQK